MATDSLGRPRRLLALVVAALLGPVALAAPVLTAAPASADPVIAIDPVTAPPATVGVTYAQAFTASGGADPYAFAVTSGALPAGLSLADGTLTGTPTAGGTYNFAITATDHDGFAGTRAYSLTVAAPTISVPPAPLSGTVAVAFSRTVTASGGIAPYTFAVTAGALPTGLTLSSGGVLSGTPTAGGTFNFTVTATDSSTGTGPFTGARAYSMTVGAPSIAISPVTVPAGVVGAAYSQTLSASGGTAPTSFAVTAGALPPGIVLSSAGVLSGTPTSNGSYAFTVTATDSSTGTGPFTGSRSYALTIGPATWAVAFDAAGGTAVPGQVVIVGAPAVEPTPAPTREGYAFDGWFTAPAPGGTAWDFADPVAGPMTLHAHWTKVVVPAPLPAPPTPLCQGRPATLVGTPGADRLVGTDGPDVVVALGGDDVVVGLGGDDVICGGGGDDLLRGRAGDDRVSGGAGDDRGYGGKGRDVLRGGTGADRLWGRSGADDLRGGAGHDSLHADPSDDVAARREPAHR